MATPIIMLHLGYSDYQKFSLFQAHNSNPKSSIYLITNCSTHYYPFVKIIDINKFSNSADLFAKIYIHQSSNDFEHELFCFKRWFIIHEFAKEFNLNDFICLDSDILLYSNVSEISSLLNNEEFTITSKIGPQVCYFPSLNKLSQFCNFLTEMYTSDFYAEKRNEKKQLHLSKNLRGGVCDMTGIDYYQTYERKTLLDLALIKNNSRTDNNINQSEGYEMDNSRKIKKIKLYNGIPYCKNLSTNTQIRFHALHFQGIAKNQIPDFYGFNDLEKEKIIFKLNTFRKKIQVQYWLFKDSIKQKLVKYLN